MMRWIFLITWVGILFALLAGLWMMIRISFKLDEDRADRDVTRHLLKSAIRTAIEITPDIHTTKPDVMDHPPSSMGMDFGAGVLWEWIRRSLSERTGDERRSGHDRRLRA